MEDLFANLAGTESSSQKNFYDACPPHWRELRDIMKNSLPGRENEPLDVGRLQTYAERHAGSKGGLGFHSHDWEMVGWQFIHNLAMRGCTEAVVDFLVVQGADLQVKNNLGETPLCLAAMYGNVGMVRALLRHGV